MNIAIIDDLKDDRNILYEFLSCYCKNKNILFKVNCFEDGESFLKIFEKGLFDIIFLDIYMNKLNGIETAEKIREKDKKCLLVFSTTSETHAIKSFKVRASNYMLKPLNYNQFKEVMDLCDFTLFKRSIFIEIKEKREITRVNICDIIYTDYCNHYIQIHTNKRIIKTYMKFSEFSTYLLKYQQFIGCYRNCIINMDYVSKFDEKDFLMQNGEKIPISRTNRKSIKQHYADYVFSKLDGGM